MTSIVSIFVRSITGAALVAALASASPASAADAPDIWITTKVKMALLMAPDVSATAVRVDTTEGKVTLHGTVSSADEKARAERAAAGVEGAREVRNLLQVVDEPRQESMAVADQALSAEVQKRLGADPALQKSSIGVKSVNQGVVLLEGEAPTLSTHLHALAVARAVPGVKQVASEIESPDTLADDEIWRDAKSDPMAPVAASMRDAWITTEAKVRLIANPDTSARDINVDTVGGAVTLFGSVPTEAAKRTAEMEIRKVDGVKGVENALQIVPHVSAAAVERQDEQVADAVEQRLKAREDLSDASIDVEVANGVTRLTGSVRSQADRLTALTIARSTDGVRSVVGDLTVKPE
ncbi:MAG: BON domain-containing protein [Myxococcota bacterium]|nr:BON domain-containing protein [Myxococcota bacterium]